MKNHLEIKDNYFLPRNDFTYWDGKVRKMTKNAEKSIFPKNMLSKREVRSKRRREIRVLSTFLRL